MLVNFSYRFRIYPNKNQKILLEKHFGCVRHVWNYFLNERKEYYLNNKEDIEARRIKGSLNYYDNCKKLIEIKKEKEWLRDVNSQSLQASLKHLDGAYNMFFRKTHRFPQFKNKNKKQSFTIPQHFTIEKNKMFFPKFKEGIKINLHRECEGKFVVATLSKTPSNQYYISICVEKEIQELPANDNIIGIDVGIKDFAVCSDGKIFENKKHLIKKEKKLKSKQRQLSKKKKGSANRKKKKLIVAKLHQAISNSRNDYLHNISHKLTSENQTIVIEDIRVKELTKNPLLAKYICDIAWGEFVRQLEYKSKWRGRNLIKIDRFFPSSKTCNNCNYINQELKLSDRTWKCPCCNSTLDRDFNASQNILKQGLLIKTCNAVGVTV